MTGGRRAGVRSLLATIALTAAVLAGAWGYVATLAWGMRHMDRSTSMWLMPHMTNWDTADLALVLVMWAVMMAAMMLPSVVPVIAASARQSPGCDTRQTAGFMAGYTMVWTAFSVLATLLHWALLRATLLSPMMESTSRLLSAVIVIAAGLYQLSPAKQICLRHCRQPSESIFGGESKRFGAVRAGVRNGVYCLGCCWALMAMLFATGVMNVPWIVILAGYVVVEKTAPGAGRFSRAAGVLLCAAGIALATRS